MAINFRKILTIKIGLLILPIFNHLTYDHTFPPCNVLSYFHFDVKNSMKFEQDNVVKSEMF